MLRRLLALLATLLIQLPLAASTKSPRTNAVNAPLVFFQRMPEATPALWTPEPPTRRDLLRGAAALALTAAVGAAQTERRSPLEENLALLARQMEKLALLPAPERPGSIGALLRPVQDDIRRIGRTDEAWADALLTFAARWADLALSDQRSRAFQRWLRDYQAAFYALNTDVLARRGLLFLPDPLLKAGARLARVQEGPATEAQVDGDRRVRRFRTFWGDRLDMGLQAPDANPTTSLTVGYGDRVLLFMNRQTFVSQHARYQEIVDRGRNLRSPARRRFRDLLIEAMKEEGLLDASTLSPLFYRRNVEAFLWHETAHAVATSPTGFRNNEEPYALATELQSGARRWAAGRHVLFAFDNIDTARRAQTTPTGIGISVLEALSQAAGALELGARILAREESAAVDLYERFLSRPSSEQQVISRQTQSILHKGLPGPESWRLIPNPNPLPEGFSLTGQTRASPPLLAAA